MYTCGAVAGVRRAGIAIVTTELTTGAAVDIDRAIIHRSIRALVVAVVDAVAIGIALATGASVDIDRTFVGRRVGAQIVAVIYPITVGIALAA